MLVGLGKLKQPSNELIFHPHRTLQHTLRRGKPLMPISSPPSTGAKNKNLPSNIIGSAINQQYFTSSPNDRQGSSGKPASTISAISRPSPGGHFSAIGSSNSSSPTKTANFVFSEKMLEHKFESFFFNKTRSTEFSWIGKLLQSAIGFDVKNDQFDTFLCMC